MALRLASRQARLVVFGYNAVTSRIEWVRSPASPQYAGSPLSLSGGQVMAYYKDGTASDITASCGYDPDEGSLLEYAGELNINATYTDHAGNEFTADTQIDVADVEELFFTRLSNPTQKEGTALDLSGAVLSVRYTDGTTRNIDAGSVTFEPSAGEMIGHMETLSVQATWRNPATGSDYSAQYTINVDQADGIYFSHAPNKTHYAEGEPLDISGAVITLKYKRSGDLRIVTDSCTFYPPSGEIMTPYGTSLHAYYQMPGGNQYEAETLLNVQTMTVPIDVIGQIIGEDLGLDLGKNWGLTLTRTFLLISGIASIRRMSRISRQTETTTCPKTPTAASWIISAVREPLPITGSMGISRIWSFRPEDIHPRTVRTP